MSDAIIGGLFAIAAQIIGQIVGHLLRQRSKSLSKPNIIFFETNEIQKTKDQIEVDSFNISKSEQENTKAGRRVNSIIKYSLILSALIAIIYIIFPPILAEISYLISRVKEITFTEIVALIYFSIALIYFFSIPKENSKPPIDNITWPTAEWPYLSESMIVPPNLQSPTSIYREDYLDQFPERNKGKEAVPIRPLSLSGLMLVVGIFLIIVFNFLIEKTSSIASILIYAGTYFSLIKLYITYDQAKIK